MAAIFLYNICGYCRTCPACVVVKGLLINCETNKRKKPFNSGYEASLTYSFADAPLDVVNSWGDNADKNETHSRLENT